LLSNLGLIVVIACLTKRTHNKTFILQKGTKAMTITMVSMKVVTAAAIIAIHTGLVGAWISPKQQCRSLAIRRSLYNDENSDNFLTASDLARISDLRDRHKTIPIMILDAMLPGQVLEFGSEDPKFKKLIEHVIQTEDETFGMMGLNPHTGTPLNIGVTLQVQDIKHQNGLWLVSVKGDRRLEVQGEPWLDDTNSFYIADVELVDKREEVGLDDAQKKHAERMFKEIPKLVSQWMECVYESGKTDRAGMARRLKDIGEMPKQLRDRAFWTASLLNPLPALDVCMEIRPAMLACRNDYDRINLAWAGLHSSIDGLLRAKGCFD
jgi:Lon protease-like protein